ncbi:MAG: YfhO family protein [Thermoguttaceae bacterium]
MSSLLSPISETSAKNAGRWLTTCSWASAAILLSVLAWPLLTGRVYVADDLGAFHLPLRAFYAEQLAQGEPYDWMPSLYCGFYVTGEGQAGLYHPLHQFLYRFLPLRIALGWECLLSYPLMMLGVWLWLRRRLGSSEAAAFGGLLFTFSSFNLLHFVHPNAVAIIAHVPWLLWAIDIVLTDSRRRRIMLAAAGVALLTGSQILLGGPPYVWLSLVCEVCYATFLLWTYKYAARTGCDSLATCQGCVGCATRTWPRLVIAKGIGIVLGTVQWLPTLDAWLHSIRIELDSSFAAGGSLHPINLLQLVSPYLLAGRSMEDNFHEFAMYVGVVPLVSVAWLVARHRELGTSGPLVRAAAGFAGVALLLALGQYGPLFGLMSWLPVLRCFRLPCRYLLLMQLAVAVLAAVALLLLSRETVRARRRGRMAFDRRLALALWRDFKPLWFVVGISMAVGLLGVQWRRESFIAPWYAVLAGPALMTTAALLLVAASRGHRPALIGLVLLAAGDLGWYGMSPTVYPQNATLREYTRAVNVPPGKPDGRVVGARLKTGEPGIRTGNPMTLLGWRCADGYAGLEPRQRLDYHQLHALRAAGVQWVQCDPTTADVVGLKPRNATWAEVPSPLPRVRMMSQCVASDDPAKDIAKIPLDTVALCEVPLTLVASRPGRAVLAAERPGHLEVLVDCPRSQLLVVSESYHRGWQATSDGRPREVYRTNGDFLGCLVEPGRHRVTFDFQPESLRRGRLTSCVGLAMISLCFLGWAGAPQLGPKETISHD